MTTNGLTDDSDLHAGDACPIRALPTSVLLEIRPEGEGDRRPSARSWLAAMPPTASCMASLTCTAEQAGIRSICASGSKMRYRAVPTPMEPRGPWMLIGC